MPELRVRPGERILFLGDSNTDTEYRTRAQPLGYGYVMMVDAFLAARHPELGLEVLNRGNDGDTIVDLAARWDTDVLALRPDWLVMMIGTNDVGHRYAEPFLTRAVQAAQFEATLGGLMQRVPDGCRVCLLEPPMFDLPAGDKPNQELLELCDILAAVAKEHGCEYIPACRRMMEAHERGAERWFQNVNHPHFRGHAFLAQQVLQQLGWSL